MSAVLREVSLTHKHLLDEALWERLVRRIMKDENMKRTLAERIMDQSLAFLQLCAAEPQGHYSPSPMVDIGWHTFILYTRHYAEFCQKAAGRFIHHEPNDIPGVDYGTGSVELTVRALVRHGLALDEEMWPRVSHNNCAGGQEQCASCRPCHSSCNRP